jgi:hypothetical protein
VPDLDDADDVRVVEQRSQPRLVEEHADELTVRRQVGQDPLHDHEGAEAGQLARQRQVDLRHATGRQSANDLIAP